MSSAVPIRLLLPCPRPRSGRSWGDWFFASALGRALSRAGRDIRFEFLTKAKRKGRLHIPTRWSFRKEIDLVIRGSHPYRALSRRPFFLWVISQPDSLTEGELSEARHIFVASKRYADRLAARGLSVSYLPQCTDPEICRPDCADAAFATQTLFVGNRREYAPRPVVDLALAAGADLAVWGRGWEGRLPDGVLRGKSIEYTDIGSHYASAQVVLNDHTADMRQNGFLSNRAYDVLACGRPLMNEDMPDLPEDLAPHIHVYTASSFAGQLEDALGAAHSDRRDIAAYVQAHHSFGRRAETILEVIEG